MALDARDRKQLSEARENIQAQLMRLEGASMDACARGGVPNYRGVYAELQQELSDIDALLGGGGDETKPSGEAQSAYEPIARLNDDGTPGHAKTPSRTGKLFFAIFGGAMLVLWIGSALFALASQ